MHFKVLGFENLKSFEIKDFFQYGLEVSRG